MVVNCIANHQVFILKNVGWLNNGLLFDSSYWKTGLTAGQDAAYLGERADRFVVLAAAGGGDL
jgi:hypothetical protein